MNQRVTGSDLVEAIGSIATKQTRYARLNYRKDLGKYLANSPDLAKGFADSELIDLLSSRPPGFNPFRRPEQLSSVNAGYSNYIGALLTQLKTYGLSEEVARSHLREILTDSTFDLMWSNFNKRRLLLSAVNTVLRPMHYKWIQIWGDTAPDQQNFIEQLQVRKSLLEESFYSPDPIQKWKESVWELFENLAIFKPVPNSRQAKPKGKISENGKRHYENSWRNFFSDSFVLHESNEPTVLQAIYNEAEVFAEKRESLGRTGGTDLSASSSLGMTSTLEYFRQSETTSSNLSSLDAKLRPAINSSQLNFELRNSEGEKIVDRTWIFDASGSHPKFKPWLTQLGKALDLENHPFTGELIITSPDGKQRVPLQEAKLADLIKWAKLML